jgi:phage terminase large subunit-like protein
MFSLEGWKRNEDGIMLPEEPIVLTLGGLRFAWFCKTAIVHTKGRWAKTPLLLEPWQLGVFSEMLRTEPGNSFIFEPEMLLDPWPFIEAIVERPDEVGYDVITGRRVYREAYLQMPEKTGKSTLMSGLQMYLLGWDGEEGSEVYCAATVAHQAGIVFNQAVQTIKRSPYLQTLVRHNVLKVYAEAIYHADTDSVFRVLSSEDAHNEGLNPHGVCIDELWAHPTRALYDTLTSRIHSGTRLDPLAATITNAGDDSESICYEVYQQAKRVLEGHPDARTDLFAFVPELPKEAVDDESRWLDVNPQSYMTVDLLKASKAKQPPFVFRRRRLNVWTDTAEGWLTQEEWSACEGVLTGSPEDGDIAYLGIDLGLKRDTAAVTAVVPMEEDGRVTFETWCHVWGLANEKGEFPPCHEEVDDTRLSISLVEEYVINLALLGWQIAAIAYDPYRFERSAQELSESFIVVEFPQTDSKMVPASEDLYADVKDKLIRHDGDEILNKHVMAGVAQETGRGWRLTKRLAKKPVDALIGLAMAGSVAREQESVGRPTIERLA